MKYFIANWKANKNLNEVNEWLQVFLKSYSDRKNRQVIICPPSPFILLMKNKLKNYTNLFIGAQDISSIEKGTYTGEVTALNLSGLVNYSIIGHSERRKNFKETDEVLHTKFNLAIQYNIEAFYCISNIHEPLPKNVKFVCYEPITSISTGSGIGANESVENIVAFKKQLNLPKESLFIYGGSVNERNINEYFVTDEVSGFLIGGASLEAIRFLKIIDSFY